MVVAVRTAPVSGGDWVTAREPSSPATERSGTGSPRNGSGAGRASLLTVVREWGRIGCIGFGGPPAHIALLRELCVRRRGWIEGADFEDAIAAVNLLPGPASTQLCIYCAWRVRGRLGALVGGVAFIVPGLLLILLLAAVFLTASPPSLVKGAAAGAGSAVAAVAVQAGWSLTPGSWQRKTSPARWVVYLTAGGVAAALLGPWLVVVLVACGLAELSLHLSSGPGARAAAFAAVPMLTAVSVGGGTLLALVWVAFKVGALSYGGGFVIIPLMQADAVSHFHWMSDAQFLNAVALGQITPGPVVQTVAVVGYAAAGVPGGLLAALVAFSPSFAFILAGGNGFDRLRSQPQARVFLRGAGPAAIGAILGSAIPLARALAEPWQAALLVAAAFILFLWRRGVVFTLLASAVAGVVVGLAGGPLPR